MKKRYCEQCGQYGHRKWLFFGTTPDPSALSSLQDMASEAEVKWLD